MNDKIKQLSKAHPLVRAAFQLQLDRQLSYISTLELSVIVLAEQHDILQRKVIEYREKQIATNELVKLAQDNIALHDWLNVFFQSLE